MNCSQSIRKCDRIMPTMDADMQKKLTPGTRVHVRQQIAARDYSWTADVRGTVVDYQQKTTGSWFAHSKNDKLWLDRLVLKKDDGEITTLNLDAFTHIDVEP